MSAESITPIDLTDELLDRWIERLKDPATKRHTGSLRSIADPDAMCCLGHLADIVNPDGWRDSAGRGYSWGDGYDDAYYICRNGDEVDVGKLYAINDGGWDPAEGCHVEGRFPVAEIEALR